MVKRFRARSFKTGADQSDASSWCESCEWSTSGGIGSTARICRAAKRHTEGTGHTTYVDITRQRGYKLHPVQDN